MLLDVEIVFNPTLHRIDIRLEKICYGRYIKNKGRSIVRGILKISTINAQNKVFSFFCI